MTESASTSFNYHSTWCCIPTTECDIQIREQVQDPANYHLRYPSDYFGLVKMIIEKYIAINDREDSHFETIEAKYTGDKVSNELYKDLMRTIDTYLVYGRFWDIRLLRELNHCLP